MRGSKFVKTIVSCILVFSVMFSFAACSFDGNFANLQSDIPAQEIFRLLVAAIDDPDLVPDSYSSIPQSQKTNVNYSYFYEYVSVMRNISSVNGKISAFKIMSDEDLKSYVADSEYDYSNVVGCELLYDTTPDQPVYLFVNTTETGKAYISDTWIMDIISIYNYADHYFTMLEDENIDALFTLMRPGLDDEMFSDKAVYSRASATSDFYQMKVKSTRSQYRVEVLLPDVMRINIPEVYIDDNMTLTNHVVDVFETGEHLYSIEDDIPYYPDAKMVNFYRNSSKLLNCGVQYNSQFVLSVLGTPINTSVVELTEEEKAVFEEEYTHKLFLNYSGVMFAFYVAYTDDTEWNGVLVTMKLFGENALYCGSGLVIGMTLDDVLVLYPFIEKSEYSIELEYESIDTEVTLVFNDEQILSRIKVSII